MAIDRWLTNYCFQPIVNAGQDSWSHRGKERFAFHIVIIAIVSFMIPVMIDEHDSFREIVKSFIILASSIIIMRFVLLKVLQLCIWMFSGIGLGPVNDEAARLMLFALLKTIFFIGIFSAIAFDLGDIFLTVSMVLFLVAVFIECCDEPQPKVDLPHNEHIHI
jgi:hypothetical protein